MSNCKANETDRKRAESIRLQYISRDDNKMEQLEKLDRKVRLPGEIVSGIVGILGALITDSRKKRYAAEIIRLSDDVMAD